VLHLSVVLGLSSASDLDRRERDHGKVMGGRNMRWFLIRRGNEDFF
jgi:hypothetical protein